MKEWGASPAQRRAQRIAMKGKAILMHGFDGACQVIPPLDQGGWSADKEGANKLRVMFDASAAQKEREARRKFIREITCEMLDASASGVGVKLPLRDIRWVRLGALVALLTDPKAKWLVGVVRRMNAGDQFMQLGLEVLSRTPQVAWLQVEDSGHNTVWDEEKRFEQNFGDYYQKGILLEAPTNPVSGGDVLFFPRVSSRGSMFDFPTINGDVRIGIQEVKEETPDYQRVTYQRLAGRR
jgi:hypothetical protein